MDEIQKILIKAGRKDLAQKYYEKTAGSNYELYQATSAEDVMKRAKGSRWCLVRKDLAQKYLDMGDIFFVLENGKVVAAVSQRNNDFWIYDTSDREIASGPIFDFVKSKLPIGTIASVKTATTYTVMGAHPGDGATVNGTSFEDAFANFCRLDRPDISKQEMLQDFKDQKIEFKKISPTEVQAGDYTIQKD